METGRFVKLFFAMHWLELLFFLVLGVFIFNVFRVSDAFGFYPPVNFPFFLFMLLIVSLLAVVMVQAYNIQFGLINWYKKVKGFSKHQTEKSLNSLLLNALLSFIILLAALSPYLFMVFFFYNSLAPWLEWVIGFYPIVVLVWFLSSIASTYYTSKDSDTRIHNLSYWFATSHGSRWFFGALIFVILVLLAGYISFLNPDNCNNDDCFWQLARVYDDPTFCDEIVYNSEWGLVTRDQCYYLLLEEAADLNLCHKIESGQIKRFCELRIQNKKGT